MSYERCEDFAAHAVVSGCDDAADDEGESVLVILCCNEHGREVQSVEGARVEFPNDGTPYAMVCGKDLHEVMSALRAEGVQVTEGG